MRNDGKMYRRVADARLSSVTNPEGWTYVEVDYPFAPLAELGEALRLLREVEWCAQEYRDFPDDRGHRTRTETGYYACPCCFGWDPSQELPAALIEALALWNTAPVDQYGPARTIGHAPDCPLGAFLARHGGDDE